MQPLASVVEPLTVQHCVHFRAPRQLYRPAVPRLPVNMPFCGIATMSPNGVTRFCKGIGAVQLVGGTVPGLGSIGRRR